MIMGRIPLSRAYTFPSVIKQRVPNYIRVVSTWHMDVYLRCFLQLAGSLKTSVGA